MELALLIVIMLWATGWRCAPWLGPPRRWTCSRHCCRTTGPVRIIDGPADFPSFVDGEVLVAKATAPAWTPLFTRAVAIVTDGGTLAAHASLVAREYGIPAVVGTGDATSRLHTGQLVIVDGSAGTVQLSY